MASIALTGGAYEARSPVVGAQECINLLPEKVPEVQGEPTQVAHYPTPGLQLLGTAPNNAPFRALYNCTTGLALAVCGNKVYGLDGFSTFNEIGTLSTSAGPVSIADNGVDALIVDGSASGWWVQLNNAVMTPVVDAAFYGGTRVSCLDGFFVLDRPGTNQFYSTLNVSRIFDPLYISAKANKDRMLATVVTQRTLWLLGERTAEIWSNTGAADFPFAASSGGIEQGCAARYSVTKVANTVFWLSFSQDGPTMVMAGQDYSAQRISTHAVETAIQNYSTTGDAVGWSYQLGGHNVYVLTFPTANATWCYDLSTGLWHRWSSFPGLGRHRGVCAISYLGVVLVGDYANGNMYRLNLGVYQDAGNAIRRVRAFPHMEAQGNRVQFTSLMLDMDTGTSNSAPVTLEYSDDRGRSYVGQQIQSLGADGATQVSLKFNRLGMARDRVFRVSWDANAAIALRGAWVETRPCRS